MSLERRWLLAIWDTMLPSGAAAGMPLGASDVPLSLFADDLLEKAPGETRLGVRLATWVVSLWPILWRLKLRTFASLSAEDRLACLESLERSRIYTLREVVNLLKIMGCMGYCGSPEVQRGLGMNTPDTTPAPWMTGQQGSSPRSSGPASSGPASSGPASNGAASEEAP